jgi:hypothetical protein
MDMSLMRDFEDFEGNAEKMDQDNPNQTASIEDDDDDDDALRPINCSTLPAADIQEEMIKRGIKLTGFPDTDRETLQRVFDEEFKNSLEELKIKRREAKRRAQLQAGLQKRRMLMEKTLQEEQDALAKTHQLALMLDMVRENMVQSAVRLDLDSITARVLAKAMWVNHTITCLDLSSNDLNDHAGSYLARIIKRNFSLKKLELDNNRFGVRTCEALGESLKVNNSLVYLSLDSNPLVDDELQDVSGIKAMADALRTNTTLTSLNLWRTRIPAEGGVHIANAVEQNNTLLFLEVGHNRINMCDVKRVADKLDMNLAAFEAGERAKRINAQSDTERQRKLLEDEEQVKKDAALKVWLQERREQRAEERRTREEERILEAQAEAAERAKAEAEARKVAAKKAEEEAAKKKEKAAKAKK